MGVIINRIVRSIDSEISLSTTRTTIEKRRVRLTTLILPSIVAKIAIGT